MKRPVTIFLSGGFEQRIYDHYFPDLLGVDRKDKLRDLGLGARWQVTPSLELSAQYTWQKKPLDLRCQFLQGARRHGGRHLSRRF